MTIFIDIYINAALYLSLKCEGEYMSETEVELFQAGMGKPVESIQSSRFCHGFYLGQVHEIIKHSQVDFTPVSCVQWLLSA